MDDSKRIAPLTSDPASLSTKDLLKALIGDVTELVKTEVALAKVELKRDFKAEVAMAKGLGAAALLCYLGLTLLFVTIILALGEVLPPWAAGLLVAALVLSAAGVSAAIGWARRVRHPLERTRREARAALALAKERFT